jgi:hypothetical protein
LTRGRQQPAILQSRDIIAYIAAYSAANAMPADSAWGTAPGGTYRDVGYTDGGLGFNRSRADLRGRAGSTRASTRSA